MILTTKPTITITTFEMKTSYLILLIVLAVLVHVSARNIPNEGALAPVETTKIAVETGHSPSASGAGVDDEKNFVTFGGVGGFAGIGGVAGVIPVFPVFGGLGGGGGGLGGLPGLGGLGGAGTGNSGTGGKTVP